MLWLLVILRFIVSVITVGILKVVKLALLRLFVLVVPVLMYLFFVIMVQNPFCKCLHPKRIMNPYTKESMVVPCGHCQACTLAKNSRYAFQCDLESYTAKHTLFITLTYANRFIPRAMFVDSIERPYGCDLIDKETGEILGPADLTEDERTNLLNKFYLFGDVPYLRKTDLQLFLKRLRYYVTKQNPRKKCVTLLSANTDLYTFARIIISYYSSNQMKRYRYVQRIYLKHGPLVVSIVKSPKDNVLTTLRRTLIVLALYPKFLKLVPSVRSAFILKNWVKAFLTVNVKKYTRLPLKTLLEAASYSMENIKSLTYGGRVTLFSTHDVKDLLLNLHVNVLTLTQSMIQRGYYSPMPKRRSRLRKEIAIYIYYFHNPKETYLLDLYGYCSDQSKLYELSQYFYDSDVLLHSFNSGEFSRYVHRIYTELLISKHFLYFVCTHNTLAERKSKQRLIEEFYSRLDYMHLTKFFEAQQLFYESDLIGDDDLCTDNWDNSYYPYFYNNVYTDTNLFEKTPVYRLYSSDVKKLFNDRIKHKKLNDANKVFFE